MSLRQRTFMVLIALSPAALAFASACESQPTDSPAGGSAGGAPLGGQGGGGAAPATGGGPIEDLTVGAGGGCEGLACQQVACAGEATTTVSGVVYAPEGKTPLYNVVVYVPNAPLEPLPEGASCDQCGSMLSGKPLVTTITDTKGHFVLKNVPVGADIPLVVQVGKWRRQVKLPMVAACQDNAVSPSGGVRLPRNRFEGDIPRIALTTGGADPLECLLRKIGLDDSEFATDTQGDGRVHLYWGYGGSKQYNGGIDGGAQFTRAKDFWATTDSLMRYDVVLLACEGSQNADEKPQEALDAIHEYTQLGGRVFASHWHNYFLDHGPGQFPDTATFHYQPDLPNPITAQVDTSFPKGEALADWLLNVGASQVKGEIEIKEGQHTVDAANPEISRQWIVAPGYNSVQYFTFNTPIGVPDEQQCGRVVFSDIHVSSGDKVGMSFPDGCVTNEMSPQEKALLFMLFDLSSCILPDEDPPMDPPT